MNGDHAQQKSCDPQLLDEQPTESWGIDKLGKYAQDRHREIEADEQSLAQIYWRLGLALNLARREFAHGQWAKFLSELGIDKTRASKARAIQRSFETEKSVEGMSVQETYRARKRKRRTSSMKKSHPRTASKNERLHLADWLIDVCNNADFYQDEVETVDSHEAANVLPALETAIEELIRLKNRIQLCASSPSAHRGLTDE